MKLNLKVFTLLIVCVFIAGCKRGEVVPVEPNFQDVLKEFNFKVKDENNTEKRVLKKYGTVKNWRNKIISVRTKKKNAQNFRSSNSGYNLTVIDEFGFQHNFSGINETETIVDFLEVQGYFVQQCDRAGASDVCIGRIISGYIDQYNQSFLNDCEVDMGYFLPCVSYCSSDCVVKIDYLQSSFGSSTSCESEYDDYWSAVDCKIDNNLAKTAGEFIGSCVKSSVWAEFPGGQSGTFKDNTVGHIKQNRSFNNDYKTAWKLISRREYRK